MLHKLKIFGSALVVVLGLSTVWASGALASVEFHSEKAPVTLTGVQEGESNSFDIQFGHITCKIVKYSGRVSATTVSTFTLTPVYEGCKWAGVSASMDMNGCDFLFHVNNEGPPYRGPADIVCPAGAEITATGGTICVLHIPAQTGLGLVTYTNIGAGETKEITLDIDGIQNLKYKQTAGSGAIKCTTLESSSGKFTGTAPVTGETDDGVTHTGIWIA